MSFLSSVSLYLSQSESLNLASEVRGWSCADQSQARAGMVGGIWGQRCTMMKLCHNESMRALLRSCSVGWQIVQGCDCDRPVNPGLHFLKHTHWGKGGVCAWGSRRVQEKDALSSSILTSDSPDKRWNEPWEAETDISDKTSYMQLWMV